MQLTELVLHNVGVYQGRQVIDLATSPERPVILIGGLNGCGKTTLLDALQLVLYGNRARLSNRSGQAYEDFLRESISRKSNPSDGASVSLSFLTEAEGETQEYAVTRSWAVSGKRTKETLSVTVNGTWSRALSDNWADHIEEILPLEIASLFFFDGEKIEALADPANAAAVVQTAVHSLLGISTIEQLRTDLLALQRRQVTPGADGALDQRVSDLREQAMRVQESLDDVAQRRARVRKDQLAAEGVTAKAESAFSKDGGDLYERRQALQSERDSAAAQLEAGRSQLRSLSEGILPLNLLTPVVTDLIEQSTRESRVNESTRLLEILAERDERVLGKLPSEIRSTVSELLASERTQLVPADDVDCYLGLSAAETQELAALPLGIRSSRKTAKTLLKECETHRERVDQLDRQLAGVPADDLIANRQRQLVEARSHQASLSGQAVVLDEDLERLRREQASTEESLNRAEAERIRVSVQRDDVARIIHHADRVRETLSSLSSRLVDRHINRIEIATLDSFRRLMRKDGLVADLTIDPQTFAIQLIGQDGEVLPSSRLSAGERQLLAVALLWGLARVAGNRLPTVIDTPLGRLDSRHREHLVDRYFPQASRQVLLLSTDEEIDEGLLRRLAPSISRAYVLSHDDTEHVTQIETGYWWPLEVVDVA